MTSASWQFDRHLRYDELVGWLEAKASAHPDLVSLEHYGTSSEGRPLVIVTVTDEAYGPHDTKPAHWVDANIHATELTACIAACRVIDHLITGYEAGDAAVCEALATRTFYVVPRVNPDGAELALADVPRYVRSSTRPWPHTSGDPLPGLFASDIDGDGRVLQMRIEDPAGGWTTHPADQRLMIPVPIDGAPAGAATYRLLTEGSVVDYDGFTVPTPKPPEGLDLNRNFPSGWGTSVHGSGDHPLSEPEIDALVRAMVARPNICGSHAFHTSGGVLLRPSSTQPDRALPPFDVWAWTELGVRATELTGYPVHSVYEDFTWDPSETMSGAADDWAYDHLGIYSWTTEFWDVVEAATGSKQSTKFWYTGPTDEEALAVLGWVDQHWPTGFEPWRPFDHPQLGPLEVGGFDRHNVWNNPPPPLLADAVDGHAEAIVVQALASPHLEINHVAAHPLGNSGTDEDESLPVWRLEVGIANTGWLPTDVSARARKENLVLPGSAVLSGPGVDIIGGPAREEFGQLDGRAGLRFRNSNDGTADRALLSWVVKAQVGTEITVEANHERAGSAHMTITLD
jgi:hypothetical protein